MNIDPKLITLPDRAEFVGVENTDAYRQIFDDSIANATAAQGHWAFGSTRAMAAAHEAGYWLWLASHGRADEVSSARIWQAAAGEWVGFVKCSKLSYSIEPDTPADDVRAHVEYTISGCAGEYAAGLHRAGSCLGEQALCKLLCAGLAGRREPTPGDGNMLFFEVMSGVLKQIEFNRAAFDAIRHELDRRGFLRGKDVARLSALVKPWTNRNPAGEETMNSTHKLVDAAAIASLARSVTRGEPEPRECEIERRLCEDADALPGSAAEALTRSGYSVAVCGHTRTETVDLSFDTTSWGSDGVEAVLRFGLEYGRFRLRVEKLDGEVVEFTDYGVAGLDITVSDAEENWALVEALVELGERLRPLVVARRRRYG